MKLTKNERMELQRQASARTDGRFGPPCSADAAAGRGQRGLRKVGQCGK